MKVHLSNYINGQSIHHSSLLILKGFIEFEKEKEKEFQLKTDLKIIHNSKECSFSTCSTNFILLAKLSEGSNTFDFIQKLKDKSIAQIKLTYNPPNTLADDYTIITLLVLAKDTEQIQDSQKIHKQIDLGLKIVQAYFAEKLYQHGFPKRSFQIQNLCPKILRLELSAEEISQLDTYCIWEHLAKVIRSKENLWNDHCKYVAFIANPWKKCDKIYPKDQQDISKKVALGGGGLALINLEFVQAWPDKVDLFLEIVWNSESLDINYPHLLPLIKQLGNIGRTVGDFVSSTLGSLAHEIGHVFDLGHSESGLMSSQFYLMKTFFSPLKSQRILTDDDVSISISCAILLVFHKWFKLNTDIKEIIPESETPPELIRNHTIISKAALTTIQLREIDNGKVLKEWDFVNKILQSTTHEFQLTKNYISIACKNGEAQLIAQNLDGNILKINIYRDNLPQSFTRLQKR